MLLEDIYIYENISLISPCVEKRWTEKKNCKRYLAHISKIKFVRIFIRYRERLPDVLHKGD